MPETKQGRKNSTAEERIRNFRMIDDLFFGAVLDNDVLLTGKILSLILGRKIDVVSAVAERTEIVLSGRGIRSDLKAVDTKGNRFGMEAQKRKPGMNPKRLSYNLAMMADGIMEKGCNDWNQMKHRYAIMFCESDYFGNGRAITYCETTFDGRPADVGTTMIYVNCEYRGDDEIGRLIHDMMCSNPDNIYDKDIREKVKRVKEGKEIRRMCEVLDTAVRKAVSRERQKLNTEKNREIAAIVREKDHVITKNKQVITEKDRVITVKNRVITVKNRVITEKDRVITKNNQVIADMDRSLKFKNQQIESLRSENELLRKRIASAIVKNS